MKSNQQGFTLIEILLASALSSLLLLELFSMYADVLHSEQLRSQFAAYQDQHLFLTDLLMGHIRAAGDARCMSSHTPVELSYAVRGYNNLKIPKEWHIDALSGSDILVLGECLLYQQKNQFIETAYFIGDTRRKDAQGHEIDAFYQKILGGRAEELISNISTLNIRYGIQADFNAVNVDQYLTASQVVDWKFVRSIEVEVVDAVLKKPMLIYIKLREQYP